MQRSTRSKCVSTLVAHTVWAQISDEGSTIRYFLNYQLATFSKIVTAISTI
jgi:hypothetical protein